VNKGLEALRLSDLKRLKEDEEFARGKHPSFNAYGMTRCGKENENDGSQGLVSAWRCLSSSPDSS
jgi:hypothetical protein